MSEWFARRGELARDGWEVVVDDTREGWAHTGLRIGGPGEHLLPAAAVERIVIPLEGDVAVELTGAAGDVIELAGRRSVFAGPADSCYLGVGVEARLRVSGRVAVAEAPATAELPTQVLRSAETPIEHRGGGDARRVVRNFGLPGGGLDAGKLLVCEVVTLAGDWSGVPPHKHDEQIDGRESRLEEIYYFDLAVAEGLEEVAGEAAEPMGVFAAYSSPAGAIDLARIVRPGDVALIPHGYHGPAGAMPGYDMYYLNVMAGPDEGRAWQIADDPAHAWIRQTWTGESR